MCKHVVSFVIGIASLAIVNSALAQSACPLGVCLGNNNNAAGNGSILGNSNGSLLGNLSNSGSPSGSNSGSTVGNVLTTVGAATGILPTTNTSCDLNRDGFCDARDQALLQQWQQSEGINSCDLNHDGRCDATDQLIFNQMLQQQQQQQQQGGLGGLGQGSGQQGGQGGQALQQVLSTLLPMLMGKMGGGAQQAANAMGDSNFSPKTQGCTNCQPRVQKPTPSPTPKEKAQDTDGDGIADSMENVPQESVDAMNKTTFTKNPDGSYTAHLNQGGKPIGNYVLDPKAGPVYSTNSFGPGQSFVGVNDVGAPVFSSGVDCVWCSVHTQGGWNAFKR